MQWSRARCWILAAAAAGPLVAGSAAAELVGAHWNGVLYDIDPATGVASNPRGTAGGLAGIETVGGVLYGLATNTQNRLFTINPSTGNATPVGAMGSAGLIVIEGDLAYDAASGVLYGCQNDTPPPNSITTGFNGLYTIDPSTGVATLIGDIAGPTPGEIDDSIDPSGMAFDASGTLWVTDGRGNQASQLYSVDPATAEILTTTPLSEELDTSHGMVFDPVAGVMYVLDRYNLFTLDTSTGVLTLVGAHGVGSDIGLIFSGLAIAPPAAPVPTTHPLILVVVVLVSGLHLLWRARRIA